MQRTGIIYGILILLILCIHQNSAQEFSWAHGITTHTTGTAAATDPNGNCYVTGYFTGTSMFGTVPLPTTGGIDVFVAKYAPDGTLLWARHGGSTVDDVAYAICTDAQGNCYVTGYFSGTAMFGIRSVTSAGGDDMFLVKYTPDGNVEWAKSGGGTGGDYGYGCTIDATGNCVVTGSFRDAASFSTIQLTAPNSSTDAFIARYSSTGAILWATRGGGIWTDIGKAISADRYGFSYVTGTFENTASFGALQTTATTLDYPDVFVACYDSQGTPQWLQRIGSTGLDKVSGICAGIPGRVAVTGNFIQPITAGLTQLTSAGNFDAFFIQYDSAGTLTWAQRVGGTEYDESYALCNDQMGNYYLSGMFNGTASFGTTQLTSVSSSASDLFVASFQASGQVRSAIRAGGSFEDIARGVAPDGSGNAFITGSHQNGTFGIFQQLPSYGFVAKTGIPPVGVKEGTVATCVCLFPVFPNPCNPEAHIRFTLPEDRQVHLAVYNSLGEEVIQLVNSNYPAGTYTVPFSNAALASGIYFITLRTEKEVRIQKVLMLH